MNQSDLESLAAAIRPLDDHAMAAARERQGRLTKPPGSLGRLEDLSIWLAGVRAEPLPRVRKQIPIPGGQALGRWQVGDEGTPRDWTHWH